MKNLSIVMNYSFRKTIGGNSSIDFQLWLKNSLKREKNKERRKSKQEMTQTKMLILQVKKNLFTRKNSKI
jgi:hypothetical protein